MEPDGELDYRPASRQRQASVGIIEDNVELADLYVMLARTLGLRVAFVAHDGGTGVKAFATAAAEPPDVVLIDHRMPVMSGLDAMKEIRALRPSVRFIFISADEGMRDEIMAAGATAFVTKPASVRDIVAAIERVLGS